MPPRATVCSTPSTRAMLSSRRFTTSAAIPRRRATGRTCCSPSPGMTRSICAWPTTAIRSRMPTPASTGTPKPCATAPSPGKKRLTVTPATAPVTLDAPQWQQTTPHELTLLPPLNTLPRKTTLRLVYDKANLYIRAEGELDPDGPSEFPAFHSSPGRATSHCHQGQPADVPLRRLGSQSKAIPSRQRAAAGRGRPSPAESQRWRASTVSPVTGRFGLRRTSRGPRRRFGFAVPSAGMVAATVCDYNFWVATKTVRRIA